MEYKALIVEDDLRWLHVFNEFITNNTSDNPFEFIHAPDLKAAKEIIKANPYLSIILLDLILPDSQDAQNTIQEIMSLAIEKYLPVVILTVMNDPNIINLAYNSGIQDYLIKDSYEPKMFFHVCKQAINRTVKLIKDDTKEQIKEIKNKLIILETRLLALEESYKLKGELLKIK